MALMMLMSHTMVSCDTSDSEILDIEDTDIVGKWILKEATGHAFSDNEHYAVFSADKTYEVFPKGNPYGIGDKGTWKLVEEEHGYLLVLSNRYYLTIVKLTSKSLTVEMNDMVLKFQREGSTSNNNNNNNNNDNNGSASGGNGGSTSTSKLVGKWLERKYEWVGDASQTKTFTGSNRYIQLNSDMTFVVKPVDLFEAEFRSGPFSWSVQSNILILEDKYGKTMYRILSNTSTSLQLGWLDDGYVVEKVTFEKGN